VNGKEPLLVIGAIAGGYQKSESEETVPSEPQVSATKRQLWRDRIMSGLGVAFLLMDGCDETVQAAVGERSIL